MTGSPGSAEAVTAQPPEDACAAVMQALVGSGPARDDIALLMVRRQPDHPRQWRLMRMPDVGFSVEVIRGVPVVATPEDVDITNAAGLRAALLESAALGPGTFVVDMTRTQFCDTAGLHALVGAHKRARAAGGQVLLVLRGATVLRIFSITGLDA